MQIFFDLDGTLIDARQRLYRLFCVLVSDRLSFDEYWRLKRSQKDHRYILTEIFGYSNQEVRTFEDEWFSKIELPEWLSLDKPFLGVTGYLTTLNKRHDIYLITARQSSERTNKQIEMFGWDKIFKAVLVTCQTAEKCDLIRNITKVQKDDWLIGDTGKDIQTGKILGIKTAGVLSGFQDEHILIKYNPDIIVAGVLELRHLL